MNKLWYESDEHDEPKKNIFFSFSLSRLSRLLADKDSEMNGGDGSKRLTIAIYMKIIVARKLCLVFRSRAGRSVTTSKEENSSHDY